jgi:CheY-like chemotaxis protein
VGYTKEKEGYLKFFVEDTGRGIAEEDLNNVFNRFYKKNEFTQGAGLGLSICKVIVDRFNGTIQVTSKQGEGTRFEVRIPHQDAFFEMDNIVSSCGKGVKDYSRTQVAHQSKNGLSTILIAEDEDSNFLLVKTILKDKFQLIRAKNGKEAIDIYRRENIDLILMDNKMPVMSGLDALSIIRKESNTIPIIMLSAYVFDSDIETAKKAGASEYLSKPVDVKLLNETIAKFLS